MNFVYLHIFCGLFLSSRGEISVAILRSPENNPDDVKLRIDGTIDLGSGWSYSYNIQDLDKTVGTKPNGWDIHGIVLREDQNNRGNVQWNNKGTLDNQDKVDNRDNVQQYSENNYENVQRNKEHLWEDQGIGQLNNQDKVQRYTVDNQDNGDKAQWNNEGTLDNQDKVDNRDNVQQYSENNYENVQRNKEYNLDDQGIGQLDNQDKIQRYAVDNQDNGDKAQWNNEGTLDNHDTIQRDNQDDFVKRYEQKLKDNRDQILRGTKDIRTDRNDEGTLGNEDKMDIRDNVQRYSENNHGNFQWNKEGILDNQDTFKLDNQDNRHNVQRHTEQDNGNKAQWHNEDMFDKHDTIQADSHDNWDKRDNERYKEEFKDNRKQALRDKKDKTRTDIGSVGFTRFKAAKTTPHKVKDVDRTKEFTSHVFMQSMRVFDSIKKKMGSKGTQARVDELARSYKEQFADFVQQQRETTVRTKLGDQRVILHTLETSNLILQRLVNFLKADLERRGELGVNVNTMQREVDAVRQLEYQHICTKYGYCRTDKGFSTMLQNCIKILMNADDERMLQARDSITEVVKTADFHKAIDSKTVKVLRKKVSRLEKKEPEELRGYLKVLLGILSNANSPLVDEGEHGAVVKRTAALYTLLDMLEEAFPPDEANTLEWADIEKSLRDWSAGKRTDVFEIVQALGSNITKGLKKIDADTEVRIKEQVKIIRG